MKALILALALTLVGCQQDYYETNSEQNRCSIYKYEAEVRTLIPGSREDTAGIRLKSYVKVGNINSQERFLLFQTLEVSEYNGAYPEGRFVRSPKMTKSLEGLKGQTATFECMRGNVGNIKMDENLPTTLVNVVRGVVGLISINVKSKAKAYTVIEDTISGRCNATTYVQPDSSKPDEILVTKYMDCDNSFVKVVGATFFNPCKFCKEKNKNFLASSTSQYRMRRVQEDYQIMEADVLESRMLAPSNEFSSSVLTEARQKLVYKNEVECSEPVPSNLKNHGSLQFMFTDGLPLLLVPLPKNQDYKKQIEKILKSLAHQPEDSSDKISEKIQELLQAVRMCKGCPLNDILASNADYRKVMLPLITSLGERTKIQVLSDSITGRMLSPSKTLALLLACLWTSSNPTLEDLDQYKLIMEKYLQHPDAFGHATAIYAYASAIHRYCDISDACRPSDLERLADLANMVHLSEEERDVLILKAYANVQNPIILKTIAKFIPGCKSSPRSQYFALVAAAGLSKEYATKEVQLLAHQTLMNHKCATLSRMLAIKILLQSQPSLATCMTMAKAMETEPDNKVSNFFTSQLLAEARNKDPNLQEMASVISIFRQVRPSISQFLDLCSRVSTSGAFPKSQMVGVENELLFFSGGNDVIPNGVIFSSELRVHDKKYSLFEASVINFDKDNIFRRTDAVDEDEDMEQSDQKTAPFKSSIVEISLKTFGEKIISEPLGNIIQGVKDPLKKWLHKQVTSTPVNIPLEMKDSMWVEAHCIVPTCVGLPLVVSATAYSQAELNGNAHLSLVPQLNPDFKRSDLKKANIKLQTKLDIRGDMKMQLAVGINTPLVQSALVMNTTAVVKLPVNFVVKANIWEKRFKLETPSCEQKTEIFYLRSKTSSIKQCIAESTPGPLWEAVSAASRQDSDQSEENDETEDIQDSSPEKDSKAKWYKSGRSASVHEPVCYDACTFGCKVCIKSSSENSRCILGDPRYKIFGDHTLSVNLQKSHTEAPIQKLRLMLQAGSQSPAQMEMSEEQNIKDSGPSRNIDSEDQDENNEESNIEYSSKNIHHGKKHSEKQSSNSPRKILKKTVHHQEQSEHWTEEYSRDRDHNSNPSSSGSEFSTSQETNCWKNKIPSFIFVAEADRTDRENQGYKYVFYVESKDNKFCTHVAANSLDDARWKGTLDAVVSSSSAKVSMRSGDQSQDYRFEVKASTGQGAEQSSIKIMAKCKGHSSQCIPSELLHWFTESIISQNAGHILGSLEDCHLNSSREIVLNIIEKAPYTVDVEVQVHGKTRYKETVCVPFDLHMDQQPHHHIPDWVSKIHSTKEFVSWMVRDQESESEEIGVYSTHLNLTSSRSI